MDIYHDLAERNRHLTIERHTITSQAEWRFRLLNWASHVPIPAAPSPVRGRFVLIRPDHLGDVLLSTPAIRALGRAQPRAQLFALSGSWSAELLAAYDEIERVLTVPFPGFVRAAKSTGSSTAPAWLPGWLTYSRYRQYMQPYELLWRSAQMLRTLHAETAIIMRPDHWWGALLAYVAGVPVRIGYDLPGVGPFLTEAVKPIGGAHVVRQSMRLVEKWTGVIPDSDVTLSYPFDDSDVAEAEALLLRHNVSPDVERIAIHPGAGTAIKRWPVEHWAAVADALAERWQATVIFTGSEAEGAEIEQIRQRMTYAAQSVSSVSLAGQTSLGTLAALYSRTRIVLGVDSGPLHLAVAAGVSTVHLYGPADPVEFGPWGNPAQHVVLSTAIDCRPCRLLDWPDSDAINHPCVRDIQPAVVIAAALRAVQPTHTG
jgi:heptosyltransferase-2/heptosyltransferase-3